MIRNFIPKQGKVYWTIVIAYPYHRTEMLVPIQNFRKAKKLYSHILLSGRNSIDAGIPPAIEYILLYRRKFYSYEAVRPFAD